MSKTKEPEYNIVADFDDKAIDAETEGASPVSGVSTSSATPLTATELKPVKEPKERHQGIMQSTLAMSVRSEANNNLADLHKDACKKSRLGLSIKNSVAPAVFQQNVTNGESGGRASKASRDPS